MKQLCLFLTCSIILSLQVCAKDDSVEKLQQLPSSSLQKEVLDEKAWKIGGKIHFEEQDGPDYLGTTTLNKETRDVLRDMFHVDKKNEYCANNAKVLFKKETDDKFVIGQYEEKRNLGVGEEMHATLLYTSKRGLDGHETLKDIYLNLVEVDESLPRDAAPTVKQIAEAYQKIISPDWKFVISDVVFFKGKTGNAIVAKLIFDGKEGIVNKKRNPVSGNFLHITLANVDSSALLKKEDEVELDKATTILKEKLTGKIVKIANKHGQADLEFGQTGSTPKERIRP